MLSRICGLSQKTAHLMRAVQFASKNGPSVSASIFFQQRDYATPNRDVAVHKARSLQRTIADLKNRVENKSRLTEDDLKYLLTKLATEKPNAEQALDILSCCTFARLDENQNDVVKNIWKELQNQSVKLNIQHYNSILSFARYTGDVELAEDVVDAIEKNGMKFNINTYQALLGTYCKVGQIEKALDILDLMVEKNVYLNEISYNNLVQCNIICGNLDGAHSVMENLKKAGFNLTWATFEEFLKHYAKAGDLDGVEKTIERMKEQNTKITNREIYEVICELAANGHVEKIDAMLVHLIRSSEIDKSLQVVIKNLVERRLSPIVPKILQSSGNLKRSVKYLIEEMVRSSTPEPEFNETIAMIESNGITIQNDFDSFKPALDGPSADIIHRLLKHMQEKSIPATQNVFEKLIRLAAEKDANEILNVINLMCNEFKIQPQMTFVRDVILPGLKCKENPTLAFAKLQTTKIRPRTTTFAVVTNCLVENNIKMAYEFANTNLKAFYGIDLIRRPLLEAFAATRDVDNFVALVRIIYDSFQQINDYQKESGTIYTEADIQTKQKDYIGELLLAAISNLRNDTQLVTQLLDSFAREGLTISPAHADQLQKRLLVESDTEIGRLSKKLSSESLPLRPIEVRRSSSLNVLKQLSSIEIQNILEVKQAQGDNTSVTEKLLFLAYIREGNVAEIESLLAKGSITLSNSDYAQLIELYARKNNLDNALNILNRVCANNAKFKLDPIKVAKLVSLMFEKERSFKEIDALLLAHRQSKTEHRIFIFEHLLDKLAANGSYKSVDQLFDTLINYRYIEPTIESTGPIVQAYLKSGKYREAVEKYEHIASTFQLTPMTMVLFMELIKNDQIDLLQCAFDTYEKIHGKHNAMCSLAFAFIECGQDRQARAIFENDRLQNITPRIVRECKKFVQYDRVDALKVLLRTTKGLPCDRHVVYQSLLDIYVKKNNAADALELWLEYSTEDDILPKPRFKSGLISLLKANKMEIPPELIEHSVTEMEKNENIERII